MRSSRVRAAIFGPATSWDAFRPRVWPTLRELQLDACARYAERPLFGTVGPGGGYQWRTYAEFAASVDAAHRVLVGQLGVTKGARVAIISRNRPDWAIAAYGCYAGGAALVPLYENQQAQEWQYTLNDSGACVALCATPAIRAQVAAARARGDLPRVQHVVGLDEVRVLAARSLFLDSPTQFKKKRTGCI